MYDDGDKKYKLFLQWFLMINVTNVLLLFIK